MAVAERVQLERQPPFDLDGRDVFLSASMGIAVGAPGVAAGDLLREAEIALIRAKADRTSASPASSRSAAATPASGSTWRPTCARPSSATS